MEKTNKLPWIVAIGALLIIAFLVYNNAGTSSNNVITVSGTAELKVDPDKADIWATIEATGTDAAAAQAALQTKSNRVIDAVVAAGISKDDMQTTGFSVYPDYTWNPQTGEQTLKGYKASHSLQITIHDLTKVGAIVDAAGGSGALVQNVQYGLTDELKKSFDDDVLKLAADNARSKAVSLTASTGASLGKVVAIQQSDTYYPPFPYYARDAMMSEAGMVKSTDILPGPVSVTATVSVTYKLN